MAKLAETISFETQGLDKIQTLIHLLDKHQRALPEELIESLRDLADCKTCEFGVASDLICGVHPCDVECFVNDKKVNGVVSANIVLKRLTVHKIAYDEQGVPEMINGSFCESYRYPDNFVMKDLAGNELLGWRWNG